MLRRSALASAVLVLCFAAPALAASPPPDMYAALQEAAATACNPPTGCPVTDFMREEIVQGVAHYSAVLHVGPGTYDRIGIHRVVRENRPGYPLQQVDRVLLQHGSAKNFVGMFLPGLYSPMIDDSFGLAVYLAQNQVDVWGIDQRWAIVPADIPDPACPFMADWGMQKHIDDLETALAVARETRYLTKQGDDRFNLLGYSSGGFSAYGLVNQEAGWPKQARNVQGLIVADSAYKINDADLQDFACFVVDYYQSVIDAGQQCEAISFSVIGELARFAPESPSPLLPGLTNLQAALAYGSFPGFGATPFHYMAGTFDEFGVPTGLQFIETEAWLDFLISAVPWEGNLGPGGVEGWQVLCDLADSPFDDNLADIKIPIYNWGAAGGLAPYGDYTLGLVGSRDVSSLAVSLWPPEDVLLDYGHIDIFISENAPELAWAPLLDWLRNHR